MSAAAMGQITDQDVRTISQQKGGAVLGQVMTTQSNDVYVYSLNGAVNLAAAIMTATPAVVANHINRTPATAFAAGLLQVGVPVGATAVTADQYAGGWLFVNVGPGQNKYRISGNTSSAGSTTITVNLFDPLTVATTTSSRFSLYKNAQDSLVIAPSATGVAQQAAGVTNVAVTANYYFWSQVGGYAPLLSDGVITKGAGAILSDAVDGAAEIEVAGSITQRVGYAPEATVTAENRPIVLTMMQ